MASRTTMTMQPGEIALPAGADTFRGELLSAHAVRCADLWQASSEVYSDGAAEIALFCGFDASAGRWTVEVYYYSFERAIQALRVYEADGLLPEGE
jgi:hypothetical protein